MTTPTRLASPLREAKPLDTRGVRFGSLTMLEHQYQLVLAMRRSTLLQWIFTTKWDFTRGSFWDRRSIMRFIARTWFRPLSVVRETLA